jgi:hypothetical protein
MKASFARALLRLAAACMGERKRDWAMAMEAELETAIADGAPVQFAFGCLLAPGAGCSRPKKHKSTMRQPDAPPPSPAKRSRCLPNRP